MKATATQCSHGWTLVYLRAEEATQKALVAAWETGNHPMKAGGLEGAKAALASVQGHIAETTEAVERVSATRQ